MASAYGNAWRLGAGGGAAGAAEEARAGGETSRPGGAGVCEGAAGWGGAGGACGAGGVRAAGVRKKKSARAGVARATKKNKVVGGIRVRDAESRARAIAILAERRGLKMDED